MVKPLNEPDDLKARLKFLGPNSDQWDLEDRLLDATLDMDSKVGTKIEEKLRPTVEDQTDFSFAFSNLHSVIQVEIKTHPGTFPEKVDSSNYTVTLEPDRGTPTNISFDQSWAEDNLFNNDYRLRVFYVPDIFAKLELKLAKWDVAIDSAIQTGDDEMKAQAEMSKERAKNLMRSINRTAQNIDDKDSGDTLAANFNFPGDPV